MRSGRYERVDCAKVVDQLTLRTPDLEVCVHALSLCFSTSSTLLHFVSNLDV